MPSHKLEVGRRNVKTSARVALLVLLGFLSGSGMAALNSVNGHVSLHWTYPTNGVTDDLRFQFYFTTNLALPLAQWQAATNLAATNFAPYQVQFDGTNWNATNLSVAFDLRPGAYFFVGTASNFWGETSITSNVVATPPAPQVINNSMQIQKMP